MRITHQSLTLNKQPSKRFANIKREWYRKWNSFLATLVCVLGFMLLVAVVLMNLISDQSNSIISIPITTLENTGGSSFKGNATWNTSLNTTSAVSEHGQQNMTNTFNLLKSCDSQNDDDVYCTGFEGLDEMANDLTLLLQNMRIRSLKLSLYKQGFPDNRMKPGWLVILIPDIQISELLIIDSQLEVIEPNAFQDKIFSNMKSLTFRNLKIRTFQTDMFNNLNGLQHLMIDNIPLSAVEENVLQPMQDSLESLSIYYASAFDLYNLTGSVKMRKLTHVVLDYNEFEHLENNSLEGLTAVMILSMQRSNIKSIGLNTFNRLSKTLLSLYLEGNYLETLEEHTFDNLLANKMTVMFLKNNNWKCTCDLKWLGDLVKTYPSKLLGLLCQWPLNVVGQQFQNVNFCDQETSSTLPSSSFTTYETTTYISIPTSSISTTHSDGTPSISTTSTDGTTTIPTSTPSNSEGTTFITTVSAIHSEETTLISTTHSEGTTPIPTSDPEGTTFITTVSSIHSEETTLISTTYSEGTTPIPTSDPEGTTLPPTFSSICPEETTRTSTTYFEGTTPIPTSLTSDPEGTTLHPTFSSIHTEETTLTSTTYFEETTPIPTSLTSDQDETTLKSTYYTQETSLITTSTSAWEKTSLTLNCVNQLTTDVPTNKLLRTEFGPNKEIPMVFYIHSTKFRVFEGEEGTINLSLNVDHMTGTLLYFDNSLKLDSNLNVNHEEIGCHTNVKTDLMIRNLKTDSTYTFCFIPENDSAISPFQCSGLYIQPPLERRTWITNDQKPLVLGSSGGGFLLMFILGCCLFYFLVRRYPSWLAGSRVLVVKHRAADAIVFPPDYLQPKPMTTLHFKRRLSDSSFGSYGSYRTYVSAVEPTPRQLMIYRLDQMRSRWTEVMPSRAEIPKIAPPLPPHPPRIINGFETDSRERDFTYEMI